MYLRKHPELNKMISVFLFKVLEEKPSDILTYAGDFFDQYIWINQTITGENYQHSNQALLK